MATAASLLLLCCCCAARAATAAAPPLPTCGGSGSPAVLLGEPLPFCGYMGTSCCDAGDDAALRDELASMAVPDACEAIIKSLLCTKCIPGLSSSVLNTADVTAGSIPLLCASTSSSSSAQHQPITTASTGNRAHHQEDSMCIERISSQPFQTMAAHPDGSSRVFLSTRDGKIFLASMPGQESGGTMKARLFLDLTDRVHHDAVLGLVGVAIHPEFASNGRFFVSYNCDSNSSPACGGGRCWDAAAGNQSRPCRYKLAVAEFSAKGGGVNSKVTHAAPYEVRRIITLGLPQPHKLYSYQTHGGQLLFQPGNSDDLYLITGNGDSDSSKNERSLSGKIMRFNVGRGGSSQLTGIHGTGKVVDYKNKPDEIFAVGLNNPSACSFDSGMPSHLFCGNVNEHLYERVYLVTLKKGPNSGGDATASLIVNHGRPADGRMPSIVGGMVYRGSKDPSLNGRYLYVYSSGVWTTVPAGRGNGRALNIRCSVNSPLPCRRGGITGGRVLSLGEDNSKDAFFLTSGGVFRVVAPGACGVPTPEAPQQQQWPPGTGWVLSLGAFALAFACYMIWSTVSGGGQINARLGNINFLVCNYHHHNHRP